LRPGHGRRADRPGSRPPRRLPAGDGRRPAPLTGLCPAAPCRPAPLTGPAPPRGRAGARRAARPADRAYPPRGRAGCRPGRVLAQAVQDLFPGTRLGIGPPIDNGFYYDFLPERPFTPEDLSRIEKRMQEIVKAAQRFSRRPISDDAARAELAHEPFKLELIGL